MVEGEKDRELQQFTKMQKLEEEITLLKAENETLRSQNLDGIKELQSQLSKYQEVVRCAKKFTLKFRKAHNCEWHDACCRLEKALAKLQEDLG